LRTACIPTLYTTQAFLSSSPTCCLGSLPVQTFGFCASFWFILSCPYLLALSGPTAAFAHAVPVSFYPFSPSLVVYAGTQTHWTSSSTIQPHTACAQPLAFSWTSPDLTSLTAHHRDHTFPQQASCWLGQHSLSVGPICAFQHSWPLDRTQLSLILIVRAPSRVPSLGSFLSPSCLGLQPLCLLLTAGSIGITNGPASGFNSFLIRFNSFFRHAQSWFNP